MYISGRPPVLMLQILNICPYNPVLVICQKCIYIDKMDGRGHFNTARCERLLKKTKVTRH